VSGDVRTKMRAERTALAAEYQHVHVVMLQTLERRVVVIS